MQLAVISLLALHSGSSSFAIYFFFSLIICFEALQNIHHICMCFHKNVRVSKMLFGFGGFFFPLFLKNGTESLMEILVFRKSSEKSGYQKC